MARIRTIKPEFFRHEGLQDLERDNPGACVMLVFAGLWGHCDKGGVFEWKPRTLKLDILPFLDFDMAETLALLTQAGLITRYAADGKEYGLVPTFAEHQRIGGKEAQEPEKHPRSNGEASGKHQGLQEGKGREKERKGDAQARATPGLDLQAWDRWLEYRKAKRKPIGPESAEAAAKALAGYGRNQAAVVEQSISNGWQGLFALKDVPRGTSFVAGRKSFIADEGDRDQLIKRAERIGFRQPFPGESMPAYETMLKREEIDTRERSKSSGPQRFGDIGNLAARQA